MSSHSLTVRTRDELDTIETEVLSSSVTRNVILMCPARANGHVL